MLLKNTTARLISINTKMKTQMGSDQKIISAEPGKVYDILPAGPAVKVPESHCKGKYVQAHLETGDLIAVDETKEDKTSAAKSAEASENTENKGE